MTAATSAEMASRPKSVGNADALLLRAIHRHCGSSVGAAPVLCAAAGLRRRSRALWCSSADLYSRKRTMYLLSASSEAGLDTCASLNVLSQVPPMRRCAAVCSAELFARWLLLCCFPSDTCACPAHCCGCGPHSGPSCPSCRGSMQFADVAVPRLPSVACPKPPRHPAAVAHCCSCVATSTNTGVTN